MPAGRKYPCPCSICKGNKFVVRKTLQRHAKNDASGDADEESDHGTLSESPGPSLRPRKRRKNSEVVDREADTEAELSEEENHNEPGERVESEEPVDTGNQIEDDHDINIDSPCLDDNSISSNLGDSDDDLDMYMDADEQIEWLEKAPADPREEDSGEDVDNSAAADPVVVFSTPVATPQANNLYEEEEDLLERDAADGPGGSDPGGDKPVLSDIDSIRLVQQFIEDIKVATLDNDNLDPETIESLRNPRIPDANNEDDPIQRLEDPDIRLAVDLYLACASAPQAIYRGVRSALLKRFPNLEILSLYAVKKLIATTTGVAAVQDDMCINSCHAFTGPLADRDTCLVCSAPRYDPVKLSKGIKVAQKRMCTLPLGPQIQTLRFTEKGAKSMRYRHEKTQKIIEELNQPDLNTAEFVYDDVFSGSDYINLATKLKLTADDTVVTFSIDGAQLYQQKKSDTWIGIWVINDFDPKTRFKKRHVLPALVVPGPGKPKLLDSFLYRSFHHLSALQRQNNGLGLRCWDALQQKVINSRIIFLLANADAVALPDLDGRVGHHGAHGCRTGCGMKGRHKPNIGHYFAAHLKPDGLRDGADCSHPDIDIRNLDTPSTEKYTENLSRVVNSDPASFEANRKDTGISKPSILSGLFAATMLLIPLCFTVDLMHLIMINIPQLLVALWQGKLKCESTDKKADWDWVAFVGPAWKAHGKRVAEATKHFPSSFHRPPRNPAEKISSGFKATEYYLYIFGLGPGFFRVLLPQKYWRHFCKLVRVARILMQRDITGAQIREAYAYSIQFVEDFELLYYQRRLDRLHFCRPALHTLLHCAKEVTRIGPGAYNTQLPMERSIFIFSCCLRLHSNPHANLREIMIGQAQISALANMFEVFDNDDGTPTPKYAHKLDKSDGYILLHPRDTRPTVIENVEQLEILHEELEIEEVARWGRLRLPNGQIARSVMSESPRVDPRNSRNVKIYTDNGTIYGEVHFYFLQKDDKSVEDDSSSSSDSHDSTPSSVSHKTFSGFALVSVYGPPDADLLFQSSNTLIACEKRPSHYQIIDISSIISVISMQPLPRHANDTQDLFFVVEKSGLEDTELTGMVD